MEGRSGRTREMANKAERAEEAAKLMPQATVTITSPLPVHHHHLHYTAV